MAPAPRAAGLAVLALGALASAAAAQDEAARRVSQILGTVESPRLALPLLAAPGLVARQELIEPGAEGLRLELRLAGLEEAGDTWSIRVLDRAGAPVWTVWAGETDAEVLWSPPIAGSRATLEVYSVRPATPLRVTLERLVVLRREPAGASITGANQLAPIGDQEEWLVELGRAVARLSIAKDDGRYLACTAFLVGADLLLTNEHCIATDAERASALVEFDYDAEEAPTVPAQLSDLLAGDFTLDYALVRLEAPVERAPPPFDLADLTEGQPLFIVQHPGGDPKQVSVLDCAVAGLRVPGRGTTELIDFGHACDTLTGSSGAPVFDLAGRRVVGLHHLGVRPGSGVLVNSAVPLRRILDDLDPDLRLEIEPSS